MNSLVEELWDEWSAYPVEPSPLVDGECAGLLSGLFSDRGDPKKRYRLTESGYADLREWEEDIAVRKRHFDTFLRRYAALKDKVEETRREGEGNPGRFRAE